jgi:hypothetical protein
MMANINCIFHDDRTPSMTVYGDFAYCHVCHISVPTKELNIPSGIKHNKREPTNIDEKMAYIKRLPTKLIRGLHMPYDSEGFYVVWPDKKFYKKRLTEGKSRYVAPTGHKPPLYVCNGSSEHLLIVEGELNAASIYPSLWDEFKIVSPGSAGEMQRHIAKYLLYKRITIFADYDAAGIVHSLQLKETLLRHGKAVNLVLLDRDFNDRLVKDGEESLTEFVRRNA